MPKVLVVQHTPLEALGTIADALETGGHAWQYVRVYEGGAVPAELGAACGLIVLGGPMGVYEQEKYPFLREEMRLIEAALRAGMPILGVCLGAQLLAAVLGAKVDRAEQLEVGWHEVRLSADAGADRLFAGLGSSLVAFHWHQDYFELPQGAIALASSALTPYQAFRYGEVAYGFQFHLEVTREVIEGMLKSGAKSLAKVGLTAHDILASTDRYLPTLEKLAETVFGRWSDMVHDAAKL